MGVDLVKLRVLVAVVEHNGFTAAAEHLGLSQGTVSFHVHSLERLLGKKTLEAEILKEALELTRSKKMLLRSNWPGGGDSK